MPSRLLSDEQLARYGRYTGNPNEEQLARHFHLDATDRELVGRMRGAHNRVRGALWTAEGVRKAAGRSVP